MSNSEYSISNIRWKPFYNSTKNIIISTSCDGKITQWHSTQGKVLYQFEEKDNGTTGLDYHRDGILFATGGNDNIVRLYDDETKTLISNLESNTFDLIEHSNKIFCVTFHKTNADLLVSGGWDRTIKFYDIRTSKLYYN